MLQVPARMVLFALLALAATSPAGCGSGDDDDGGSTDDGSTDDGGTGGGHGSGHGSGGAPPDCATGCQELGFATGAVEGGGCVCDEPLDEACFLGMSAACTCNESIHQPCSSDAAFNLYTDCFRGDDGTRELLLCVAGQVDDDTIDCDAAAEICTE